MSAPKETRVLRKSLMKWTALSRQQSQMVNSSQTFQDQQGVRTSKKSSDGMLGILRRNDFECTSSNYACPIQSFMTNEHWESIITQLENPCIPSAEKRKGILRTYGTHAKNSLMLACILDPSLVVVKLLVKFGGLDVLKSQCHCGNTALHYACWSNASQDVIEYLLVAGGVDTLLAKNNKGENALHTLCIRYTSNSLSDIIQLFVFAGKNEVVTATNNKGDLPIMSLLQRSGCLPVESIIVYLDEWCEVEETSAIFFSPNDSFQEDDVTTGTNTEHIRSAFTKALQQLEKSSQNDQGQILTTQFMKKYVTEKFIYPLPIAILMMDLYIQIIVVCVFSFSIRNTSPYLANSTMIICILVFCVIWRLMRETMQLMSTALGDYLGSVSNTLDLLQIACLLYVINMDFKDHLDVKERVLLVASIFIAWIELLFELANLIRSMAIFVAALFMIMQRMIRFIVTIITFNIMFAHMYHIAGPMDNDICVDHGNLSKSDFLAAGGWTCSLADSYATTFINFLNFDIPTGVPTWVSLPYAILVVILFFNIVIAEIWTAYGDVMDASEMEFWTSRYAITDEVDGLASHCSFALLGLNGNGNNKSPSTKKGERLDFNFLLEFSHWHKLEGEDKDFFHWWYGKADSVCPPLKKRLIFFIRRSVWKDILFPAFVFENVLLGKNRSSGVEGFERVLILSCSAVLMIVSITLLVVTFIAGLLSFGLLWPKEMKRQMFLS